MALKHQDIFYYTLKCNIPDKLNPLYEFANVHSKPISDKNMGLQGHDLNLCQ